MKPVNVSQIPVRLALFVTLGVLAACTPARPAASRPAQLVPFPGTPTAQCAREEVLPKITEIEPDEIRPGVELTITASGGYFKDDCGGIDESSRMYQIFFDDEPVADLSCYVNHCEGKFTLPPGTTAGAHCMGVQKGTCQLKVDVTGD